MNRLPLCAITIMFASPAPAQQAAAPDPWASHETPAGLRIDLDGKPFITRELVQLIDRSTGWENVPLGGWETETGVDLGQGLTGSCASMNGRVQLTRETWADGDALHVSLACKLADPGPATDFYYSLEIPASALSEGAWRTHSAYGMNAGRFPETAGSGPLADGFDRLEIMCPAGLIGIETRAEGAAWSFQEWRRPPHDAYRLRIELPTKAREWKAQLSFGYTPGKLDERLVAGFVAVAADASARMLSLANEEPLELRSLKCTTTSPTVGHACELQARVGGVYDDPFNPADIRVDAAIKTPSRTYSLPAFYCLPFGEIEGGGPTPHPRADWRIRFLPTEPGRHEITLNARDRSGEMTSSPLVIEVAAAHWPGLVRVSRTNPLALEWASGGTFYALGVNIFEYTRLGRPLPTERIERCARHIGRLAAAKGNFIRLRMDSWWLAIDNPPDVQSGYMGPGRFNQRACFDIDRLLELCEGLDVQVMLCFENANATVNSPREAWRKRYNTYAKENGGPCETMAEFWTDETARELFKRKIRYCVARWGASPALAMWEFFNEFVIGGRVDPDPPIAWHDEMAREFKRLDPHKRIVTTSPMGERDPEANRKLWQVEALDVAQVHDYSHINTGKIYHTAQHGAEAFGKPFIVGEFGMRGGEVRSGRFKHKDDPEGIVAHLGHWSSAMSMAAGAPLDWYVANYVDPLDLWHDFAHLKAFLADLPRTDPALKPLVIEGISMAPGRPLDEPADVALAPTQKWEKSPNDRYAVNDEGALTPPEGLNGYLWGTRNHADLRNPPTFLVDFQQPGRFVAHVMEVVGRGANPVRIEIDGETALEEDLVCELGKGEKSEVRQPGPEGNVAVWYNHDLSVEVPAGKHEVRIENLGKDRLTVRYGFDGYATRERAPEALAVGLQHTSGAHLWIHNQSWSAEVILGHVTTVPARDLRLTLSSLRDGPVELEWWNPMTGEELASESAEVRNGRLQLSIPELSTDLGCKIRQ